MLGTGYTVVVTKTGGPAPVFMEFGLLGGI